MSAIPVPDPEIRRQRVDPDRRRAEPGQSADGCRFHPRCPLRAQLGDPEICATEVPPLIDLGADHLCACHFRRPAGVPLPEAGSR